MSGDKKTKKWPVVVFAVGLTVLVVGVGALAVRLVAQPAIADAEFLVSAGEWTREDDATVVWDFADVGKGKLTTDGHLNDYDFIWALDDGKLKIETEWLYNLNDEFDYTLDQGAKTLTIKNDETEVVFKALQKVAE